MLKHIPILLTPDLFRIMMEMGHGEELLLCDANYPAKSSAGERLYVTGYTIVELLESILYYFPLDTTVRYAAVVMEACCPSERFGQYKVLIEENGSQLEVTERYMFYERAKAVFAKVITTDTVKSANIIIKKGIVTEADLPARHAKVSKDGN